MNTRLKRLRKKILALVVSAAMLLLLVPGFSDDIQADGGITVSFRLIGCTKSTGKIELIGRGKKEATGYLGAEYVTWIPTKSYSLDMGSTVYDLFTKALSEAGLSSTGAEGNYVKSITAPAACGGYTLAEFTNGQYSGWMYTVNGSHSDVGLQMCPLNDGDQVIFHYVNDYACESADWQGGLPEAKEFWNAWLNAPDTEPSVPVQTEPPTEKPTEAPTEKPTEKPTEAPTEKPTEKPTEAPTEKPTEAPTEKPTEKPTEAPTEKPTEKPTEAPTEKPTEAPTEEPTEPQETLPPEEKPEQKPQQTEPQETETDPPQETLPTEKPTEKPTEAPAAKNLKISVKKVSLLPGDTYRLSVTLTPAGSKGKVTWSSLNKKVVTVDADGVLTVKGEGTATVTAALENGKKVTCKVTVKGKPVTKVKLNKTKATLKKGKTLTLKATLTPENASEKVTWSSSNKKVVKVNKNGKVTAVKKGTAVITAKAASGKKATCKVTVK